MAGWSSKDGQTPRGTTVERIANDDGLVGHARHTTRTQSTKELTDYIVVLPDSLSSAAHPLIILGHVIINTSRE